jgi:DNA-binding transcriptional MerR regulator
MVETKGSQGAMRMAELSMRSGVPRETIHFYLREGLLPRPRKGGRTVAWYEQEHLDRLLAIRRLREEKYLPLAVIKRLLDSSAAAQDVNTLAEVLHILPAAGAEARDPSARALREALARRLLGPPRDEGVAASEPAERRVLAIVDEALALDGDARDLTLDDLAACAGALESLVGREAALFFDRVFESADIASTITALRAGRGTVARFVTAFRDLMLRRIVDDLLVSIERGPELVVRTATVPLSPEAERALGLPKRRRALVAAAGDGDAAAVARLVWHLFSTGAATEITALAPEALAKCDARVRVLAAYAAYESARSAPGMEALEQALEEARGFALGRILGGEASLARGLKRPGAGFLERAVPGLHALLGADPDGDREPVARALGWFHRARVELALPPVLGRTERALAGLRRALSLCDHPEIDAVARARVAANVHLLLGRHLSAKGDNAGAARELDAAAAIDGHGALGEAVQRERALGAARRLDQS